MIRKSLLLLLPLLAMVACGRRDGTRRRALPAGDGVWLTEAFSGAESESETETVLSRGGFARVFVPACVAESDTAPPPHPIAGASVVLVAQSVRAGEAAVASGSEDRLAGALGACVQRAIARHSDFGKVEGVHLDLPLSSANSEAFGRLAASLRSRLPRDFSLTASLRFSPDDKERESLEKRLAAVDGFVAVVFGDSAGADPISADALGKPWWAGYVAGARGEVHRVSGEASAVGENVLRALSDDSRFAMENDLSIRAEGVSGFVFRVGSAAEASGLHFGSGDQISFRQPIVSELLYRLGSDLAGRRSVRGRVVVLDGASEAERILTLAAVSDVLLGRPLAPDWRVSVAMDPAAIHVVAENRTTHSSVLSRTTNWIEVDVPEGHIRDVQPGDFDRFEMFDPQGRAVTPGRATRVRFYETLVGPFERIGGAAIFVRGRPPKGCCRYRQHLLSAAGAELSGDWAVPEGAGAKR